MHPQLVKIGPIQIYSYGAMMMLAFIAGMVWATREGKRRGVPAEQIIDLTFWILLFSLAFARIVFILLNLEFYLTQPFKSIFLWQGNLGIQGLSFHGGLFGAILGSYLFCRKRRLSWLLMADICAPAAALGYGIARIGCFLNGCCYGAPTDLPWGVRFLDEFGTLTDPSHPTQIYSALGSWLIFGILLWLRGRLHAQGQLFFSYLGLYCVLRFIMEIFRRGVTAKIAFDSLTEGQVASIIILIASVLIFRSLGKARAHNAGK